MLPDISNEFMDVEFLNEAAEKLTSGKKTIGEYFDELTKDRPALKQYFQLVALIMTEKYGVAGAAVVWSDIVRTAIPLIIAYDSWYTQEQEKKGLEESPWGELFNGNDTSEG